MKKLALTFALGLMAGVVSAAQINWGLSGAVKFDGASVGTGSTFTLVCLDGITEDWSDYAVKIASGATSEGVVTTKSTNNNGMSTATTTPWVFNWTDGSTSIANKLVAQPTDFAVLVTTTQDGKDYYWASAVYSVSESSSNWNATSKTYTMSQTAASGPNSNWTAVPEPSTAMLALAGLALLIKRRRA